MRHLLLSEGDGSRRGAAFVSSGVALRPALPSRGRRIWAVRPGMRAGGSRGTFGDGCRGQQLCALLTASPS